MWKLVLLIVSIFVTRSLAVDALTESVKKSTFFEIIINRFEILYENPEITKWNLKVRKINNTRALFGNVTVNSALGNNFTCDNKFLKKQGGEYRFLPYEVPKMGVCDYLYQENYVYPELSKNSDFPEDILNNCPLRAMNYEVRGWSANPERFPAVAAQSGEYAHELSIFLNDDLCGTYRCYAFVNKV